MSKTHLIKAIFALPLLALAACSLPQGGSGTTKDGSPVVLNRVMHMGYREDYTLSSPDGWSCTGTLDWNEAFIKSKSAVASMPLACQDGTKGTAMISVPHLNRNYIQPGQTAVTFSLENGKSGSARI